MPQPQPPSCSAHGVVAASHVHLSGPGPSENVTLAYPTLYFSASLLLPLCGQPVLTAVTWHSGRVAFQGVGQWIRRQKVPAPNI